MLCEKQPPNFMRESWINRDKKWVMYGAGMAGWDTISDAE